MARPRRGGFAPTLDPFGGARGGLGRYSITGDTITSLAQTEAYAIAVGWQNGTISDQVYEASLQHLVDLETPGTSGYVRAKNTLEDAQYSIGRNKLVVTVNTAATTSARLAALTALRTYDVARRDTMTPDNEQYREQVSRIASINGDLRQARYTDLVEKVNNGKGTTQQLLDLTTQLAQEAVGDPDADEWQKTIVTLEGRKKDEELTAAFQAYQHNRKTGASVLELLNARIAETTAGSPDYERLVNQREDLQTNIKNQADSKLEAEMSGKRSAGKLTDAAWLAYLKASYDGAEPGSAEKQNAGNRLREFTFSLAEDKLRYQVTKSGGSAASIHRLVNFYKGYRAGMSPGSERYRQLTLAIDSLSGRKGSGGGSARRGGGGGGGAGSSKGGMGAQLSKQIGGIGSVKDLVSGGQAPPDIGGLFKIDPTNTKQSAWFHNNLRSIKDALNRQSLTWTYYDKAGRPHELAFDPGMAVELQYQDIVNNQVGIAMTGNDARRRQSFVGKLITSGKQLDTVRGTATMDIYTRQESAIKAAKDRALAGGRYAEYLNLVNEEAQLIRRALGIPDGQPTELGYAQNGALTEGARGRIGRDLAGITPRDPDHPDGDPVLGLLQDPTPGISFVTDGDGHVVDAQLDPSRGYVTQAPDGSIKLALINTADPGAWTVDPTTGEQVPAYTQNTIRVTIRRDGEDAVVQQPISRPGDPNGLQMPVWQLDTAGYKPGQPANAPATAPGYHGARTGAPPAVATGMMTRTGAVPLMSTFTKETGNPSPIQWASLDGKTWYRIAPGVQIRVVMDPTVTFKDGKWQKDGTPLDPAKALGYAHVWGEQVAGGPGRFNEQAGGRRDIGAPGVVVPMRTMQYGGVSFDARPDYVIEAEEITNLSPARRAARAAAQRAAGTESEAADVSITRSTLSPEARRARAAAMEAERVTTALEGQRGRAWSSGELQPVSYRALISPDRPMRELPLAPAPVMPLGSRGGAPLREPAVVTQPASNLIPVTPKYTPQPVKLPPLPSLPPVRTGVAAGDIGYRTQPRPIPKPKPTSSGGAIAAKRKPPPAPKPPAAPTSSAGRQRAV